MVLYFFLFFVFIVLINLMYANVAYKSFLSYY